MIERDNYEVSRFVRYFSERVYNIAISYVQRVEDAEELTQDIFMAVLDGLPNFKGDARLETWLYRIAVNKALDFVKYRKRLKRSAYMLSIDATRPGGLQWEPVEFQHPGLQLESAERMQALYAAINALPEKQRTALILAKFDQMPQREVAQVMNTTVKAVESLLIRAKQNLRHTLHNTYEAWGKTKD